MLLSSCGGGGSDNSDDGALDALSAGNASELQGTWVFATAGNRTGTTCSLDVNGEPEERNTLTFSASTYTVKAETCTITIGNTAAFVQDFEGSGTYKTGSAYRIINGVELKELDIVTEDSVGNKVTYYAGYNVTGTELRLSDNDGANDGTKPGTRESALAPEVFIKQ